MAEIFYADKISCFSLELHWKKDNKSNDISYEVHQREGEDNSLTNIFKFQKIYQGSNNNYIVTDLKPDETYTFKLKKIKSGKSVKETFTTVKTLICPKAVLSEKSIEIANNGGNVDFKNDLSDAQKKLIRICSKLNFEENDTNVIKGDFNGIIIKLSFEKQSGIYFISFDISYDYYAEFLKLCLKERENNSNLIIPCYFIIQQLPAILILNLLEKFPVIFTGKRMGGVIASSLAFYILYVTNILNSENVNYGNTFIKREKNCLGVVTFGSPCFLRDIKAAFDMRKLSSYFYHIKDKFDFIPEIIDFINFDKIDENIISCDILNKNKLDNNEIKFLDKFWKSLDCSEKNINKKIKNYPFGYYYEMEKSNFSLNPINENSFEEYYYNKIFNTPFRPSNLENYKNLYSSLNSNFSKETLSYLENKNFELETIKIIRRRTKSENVKGILKFKLVKFGNNIISPDIIKEIKLYSSNNEEFTINGNNIYYDNEEDITAYIDNLNANINKIIINNYFEGEIKSKFILNIQGCGTTREMLEKNIEKLFIIPFFKLFEIFYISLKDKEMYNKLKKEYFGENFDKLKILELFEEQIQILNELLFFTRPDIIGNFEKEFIQEYTNKLTTEKQKNNFKNLIIEYYKKAKKLQKNLDINCIKSQKDSIAEECSFPKNKKKKEGINKLFMCKCDQFENENFINEKFDDFYINNFFIKRLIIEALEKIEKSIFENLNNLNDSEECKQYLNNNISIYYQLNIIPNIYFILTLILSSIESGDYIQFKHKSDWKKVFGNPYKIFRIRYEKDFKKGYTKDKIEEINMKNLFIKKKIKNLIKTDVIDEKENKEFKETMICYCVCCVIDPFGLIPFLTNACGIGSVENNKLYDFSEYSEKCKFGKEYYEKFLELLNNYSNDFPEDIETSIYDNLKEVNIQSKKNLLNIKDMMKDLICDVESKKGFLALLKQSYLLGKLRNSIVRKYIYLYNLFIGRRIYYWCFR